MRLVVSFAALFLSVALSTGGTEAVMAGAALFGFATFPIYSVPAAHAHDFAVTEERVELSAGLMFLYAVGAIASPWIVSALIEARGAAAMFVFVAAAHLALVVCGLVRMRARPAERRTRYVYAPRSSFLIGRLLGTRR